KYISFLKENNNRKLKVNLEETLFSYIDKTWKLLRSKNTKINFEVNIDYPNHENLKKKVLSGLKKTLKKVQSNKKISDQEYQNLKNIISKDVTRREERISKEIQNFEKSWGAIKILEPPWLKYSQTESGWQIYDSELTKNEISGVFRLETLFSIKDKKQKQIYSIFQEMGGMDFVIRTIVGHNFYNQLPPKS
ncbi:MAG: hypothetical protein ACW99F_09915, partial [Candidatus Hodarchaeales archaeon]